jgi:site-2 protease. Metallo peptidase. MEROPS family M50B
MTNSLISLLAFIVTLGVLITVHEFGHFWVARRLGVKVLRFRSASVGHCGGAVAGTAWNT